MKIREFFRCERCKAEGIQSVECSYIRVKECDGKQTTPGYRPSYCPSQAGTPEWEKVSECEVGNEEEEA